MCVKGFEAEMSPCLLNIQCCYYIFIVENVAVSTPLIEFMIRRREEKKLAFVVSLYTLYSKIFDRYMVLAAS